MFDGGTNCGSRTWSGGTIGGAVFGPAGPLAARTTCGVTGHVPSRKLQILLAFFTDSGAALAVRLVRFGPDHF